jgi:hypothetical protein
MKKGPGRPNLGKTETIRQRAVTVYLPTKEMLDEWKSAADQHDMSLSSFVTEIVDDAVRKKSTGLTPREELEKKLNDALAELKTLKERFVSAEMALKRADCTIAEYREKLARTVPETLDANLTSRIVALFMSRRVWGVEEMPDALGIRIDDRKSMMSIYESVKFLKAAGLVEEGLFDWRWKAGARHKHKVSSAARRRLHKRLPR